MNPFDLPGPHFLVFYAVLSAVVLAALLLTARLGGDAGAVSIDRSDPYLLACLRGGRREALRVAAISLVDRGLLEWQPDGKLLARDDARALVKRPIEAAVVDRFRQPDWPRSMFEAEPRIDGVLADYEARLRSAGLVLEPRAIWARRAVAIGLLWAVAVIKVAVAFGRGRTNVEFLLIMAVAVGYLVVRVTSDPRTAAGHALLADLRHLFHGLRDRASSLRPGGGSNELAFLAALFGLAALPPAFGSEAGAFGLVDRQRRSAAGCGASCGSAGAGSDGSSCGGGCGGGCGGCGG